MSRTYRRKKVRNDHILEHFCYEIRRNVICPIYTPCKLDCPYRDSKRTLGIYRRDTGVGYGWTVPKKICKEYNRERRAKAKAEVNRIWREEDYEEYQFDPWLKDAGWYYW